MTELPDFELHRTARDPDRREPPEPPTRAAGVWIAVAILMVVAGVAAYIAFGWRPRPAPAQATGTAAAGTASAASPPLGGKAEPIMLPPLDASDTLACTAPTSRVKSPARPIEGRARP